MSFESRQSRRPARLGGNLRQRRLRPQADVDRESALPADLFECQEPMVEAAVMDAAARVFLAKLGQPTEQDPGAWPALPPREHVDRAAIAACVQQLQSLPDEPPPDLMRGLDDERLWVLVDLARHGSGLSRQRATHELRQLVHELSESPSDDGELLRQLAVELTPIKNDDGLPVVFQALVLEVQAGLRRLDERAGRGTESRP
jgi:hypothetical protein